MGIKIIKRANGILFDTSDLPGSGAGGNGSQELRVIIKYLF